ncbi:hypothetical protein C8Q74DRAFT_1206333 [Fomes fomentarius]|nr:hypothetical protein C8Q74DRAFT_1206333 [Fomes fomentarius]
MPVNSFTGTNSMHIRQQNLNKSKMATFELINTLKPEEWDAVCLQEPWLDQWHNTRANHNWHVLYPSTHYTNPALTCSVMYISTRLAGADWQQLMIDSADC